MHRRRHLPSVPRGSTRAPEARTQGPTPAGRLARPVRAWRRWYGASPLHLGAFVASTALAGYAAVRLAPSAPLRAALWIVGAAVVHDLVLVPAYSLADRLAAAALGARGARWRNHVRVPAVWSGLLLLLFFPAISGHPEGFAGISGRPAQPFLAHWLLLTGLLFAGSALLLAFRLWRRSRLRAVARR